MFEEGIHKDQGRFPKGLSPDLDLKLKLLVLVQVTFVTLDLADFTKYQILNLWLSLGLTVKSN